MRNLQYSDIVNGSLSNIQRDVLRCLIVLVFRAIGGVIWRLRTPRAVRDKTSIEGWETADSEYLERDDEHIAQWNQCCLVSTVRAESTKKACKATDGVSMMSRGPGQAGLMLYQSMVGFSEFVSTWGS